MGRSNSGAGKAPPRNPADRGRRRAGPEPAKREPVDSSAIASVGYDARNRLLDIEFTSGTVYRYQALPPELHARLMTAASVGRFFDEEIRGAGFVFERIA